MLFIVFSDYLIKLINFKQGKKKKKHFKNKTIRIIILFLKIACKIMF